MKKYTRFTLKDLEFIKNNYSKLGLNKCAKTLGKSTTAVIYQINKLNIPKAGRVDKLPEEYNVNPIQFTNAKEMTKNSVYILGLLWADGFLNNHGRSNRISIECLKDDINEVLPVFKNTGNWAIYYRKRENKKPAGTIQTNNKKLYDFLYQNGYNPHNSGPASIINIIPHNLKRFFLLGLIDGDGCFYYNNKNKAFSITSCYSQDWDPIIQYLKYYKITCNIHRIKRKNSKLSHLKITYKDGIKRLFSLLYGDRDSHKLGLDRKYNKCASLLGSYKY